MSIIDYLKKIFSTGGAVQKRYHGNKVVFSFPKEMKSIASMPQMVQKGCCMTVF